MFFNRRKDDDNRGNTQGANEREYRPSERPSQPERNYPKPRVEAGSYRPRENFSSRPPPERRPKFFMIGDMVQVTDQGDENSGRFGLVAKIHPGGQDWQVLVKIGRDLIGFFFRQIRFCTRIQRSPRRFVERDGERNEDDGYTGNNRENTEEPDSEDFVEEMIDKVSPEDEHNK